MLALLFLFPLWMQETTTDAIARGRQIYLSGTSKSGGEIKARMTATGVDVPGALLPCVGCHGRDGKGRPEGGVYPADLRWNVLTKPYQVRTASGRERDPYDENKLKMAIAMGKDPSGNELDGAMPRYALSLADMADLIAFIRHLGDSADPGIFDDALVLGCLLPPREPQRTLARGTVDAYVNHLNDRGSLYGRRLEVRYLDLPENLTERMQETLAFVDREKPFALIASDVTGMERELARALDQRDTPLIGAMTPTPAQQANRFVFYLNGGLESLAQTLVHGAVSRKGKKAAIIYRSNPQRERLAQSVEAEWIRRGNGPPLFLKSAKSDFKPLETAQALKTIDTLFYLGLDDGEMELNLFKEIGRLGFQPRIFSPGALSGPGLLRADPNVINRLFLGFLTSPADRNPPAQALFSLLQADYGLEGHGTSMQWAILGSIYLFHHVAGKVGRDLDRDKIIQALEKLYRFESGFIPPLTFSPNRRIGTMGATIYTLDPEKGFRPAHGGFIHLDR